MTTRIRAMAPLPRMLGILAASLMLSGAQAAELTAPEIIGRTFDGKLFRLSSLRGQPLVLNFFSVSCIPCRKEMPELAEKAKVYPKVQFVSAHVDDAFDGPAVADFVNKLPARPQTIVVASQRVQTAYQTNTRGLPETHLIDAQGKIVKTLNGYTPETMAAIKDWLDKQP